MPASCSYAIGWRAPLYVRCRLCKSNDSLRRRLHHVHLDGVVGVRCERIAWNEGWVVVLLLLWKLQTKWDVLRVWRRDRRVLGGHGWTVFNVDASLGFVPFSDETVNVRVPQSIYYRPCVPMPTVHIQFDNVHVTDTSSLLSDTLLCTMHVLVVGVRWRRQCHQADASQMRNISSPLNYCAHIFDALAYSWLSLSRTPPPNDRATQTHSHWTFPGALTSNGYT